MTALFSFIVVFRGRTPSGLYSPEYVVEEAREGFEVRRYASYAICSATMVGEVQVFICMLEAVVAPF